MNARSQMFDLTIDGRQTEETVASLLHTVLFYRTQGKCFYSSENGYSMGTLGFNEVDCDFINLTYVSCNSPSLDERLRRDIATFSEMLRSNESNGRGEITLEFYQKKPRSRWLFQPESVPWEIWTIRLTLVTLDNEQDRQLYSEQIGEILADKIFSIADIMNRYDYVPTMPGHSEVGQVFDTTLSDVQPYLFRVFFSIWGPGTGSSVGSTVKKLIKETLFI